MTLLLLLHLWILENIYHHHPHYHQKRQKRTTASVPDAPPTPPPLSCSSASTTTPSISYESYVIQEIIKNMSKSDWEECLTQHPYKISLTGDLRLFLHEKYINEESTYMRQHYGELCNIAEYPSTYVPFRDDISAKNYHLIHRKDHDIPHYPQESRHLLYAQIWWLLFPVFKSSQEYECDVFKDDTFILPNIHSNGGLIVTKEPQYPAPYVLYRQGKDGRLVFVQDMSQPPHELYEQNE